MNKATLLQNLQTAEKLAHIRQVIGHSNPEMSNESPPTACVKECEKALEKVLRAINKQLDEE